MSEPQVHPRQVRFEVTLTNGVTNTLILTLHRGDFSFVQDVAIDGIKVGYMVMAEDDMSRRARCVTQEVGHKVPASTIRKSDGRLVGSCQNCYERVNIARFPGTESVAEADALLRSLLWDSVTPASSYIPAIATLEKRLLQDQRAVDGALTEVRRAKAITFGRIARAESQDDMAGGH